MDTYFTKEHLWIREIDDGLLLMGLSSHAVSAMEDVQYVDTSNFQRVVKSGEDLGSVESTKTAEIIKCPFDLEIVENKDIAEIDMEAFNTNPESEDNWLYKVRPLGDWKGRTMSVDEYIRLTGMPDEIVES